MLLGREHGPADTHEQGRHQLPLGARRPTECCAAKSAVDSGSRDIPLGNPPAIPLSGSDRITDLGDTEEPPARLQPSGVMGWPLVARQVGGVMVVRPCPGSGDPLYTHTRGLGGEDKAQSSLGAPHKMVRGNGGNINACAGSSVIITSLLRLHHPLQHLIVQSAQNYKSKLAPLS